LARHRTEEPERQPEKGGKKRIRNAERPGRTARVLKRRTCFGGKGATPRNKGTPLEQIEGSGEEHRERLKKSRPKLKESGSGGKETSTKKEGATPYNRENDRKRNAKLLRIGKRIGKV